MPATLVRVESVPQCCSPPGKESVSRHTLRPVPLGKIAHGRQRSSQVGHHLHIDAVRKRQDRGQVVKIRRDDLVPRFVVGDGGVRVGTYSPAHSNKAAGGVARIGRTSGVMALQMTTSLGDPHHGRSSMQLVVKSISTRNDLIVKKRDQPVRSGYSFCCIADKMQKRDGHLAEKPCGLQQYT